MTKALFLLYEGLPENVIDSQVLTHCKLMKNIGIDFEIWSFACFTSIYEQSKQRLDIARKISDCEVKLFRGIRPAYPFSEFINFLYLSFLLKKSKYGFSFIHARTDYAADVAVKLKTIPVIYDCRGDSIAEFLDGHQNSNLFLKAYRVWKYGKNIANAKKYSQKAIFVSSFLKNKIQYNQQSAIIGCFADSELFYYDEALRISTRKELGLDEVDKILIYSGGMNSYQCFSECINFFKRLYEKDKQWHFVVLTTQIDIAKKMISNSQNIILKKVAFQEVNKYLNAADVGIILREKHDLNRAASPTKFAEYSLAGLSIIYSKEIGDLLEYSSKIGGGYEVEGFTQIPSLRKIHILENRQERFNKAKKLLSKNLTLERYQKIYANL